MKIDRQVFPQYVGHAPCQRLAIGYALAYVSASRFQGGTAAGLGHADRQQLVDSDILCLQFGKGIRAEVGYMAPADLHVAAEERQQQVLAMGHSDREATLAPRFDPFPL